MPTILKNRFDVSFNGIPPRMSYEDLQIWQRWRRSMPQNAVALYFDVGLGEGRPYPGDAPPEFREMFLLNSQKRADVVIEYPDHWLMIELRDNAQANAVGRLALYRELWKLDPPDDRPLDLYLITNNPDPDIELITRPALITYVIA